MQAKKLITGIISFTLLTGCTADLGGLINGLNKQLPASSQPTVSTSISPASKGPKLNFTPITKEHEQLMGGSGSTGMSTPSSVSGGGVPAAAPTAAATSAPMATAPSIGIAPMPMINPSSAPTSPGSDYSVGFTSSPTDRSGFYSGWGYSSSGLFDDYILSDVQEATTDGIVGTLNDMKAKLGPYVKDWADDARLINFSANVDNTGNNPKDITQTDLQNKYDYYYYGDYSYGWMFEYVSSAKKEKLIVYVSSKESLYIKQKWTLRDLSLDDISINSDKAIQIVKDAIKDKNFVPQPTPGASITPVTAWWNGSPSQDEYQIIYDIPDDTLWNLYLYKEVTSQYNRIVWNVDIRLSFTRPKEDPQKVINGVTWYYPSPWINYGYAKVDAKTGQILELTRPVKDTPKPYPMATPWMTTPPWVETPRPWLSSSPDVPVSPSPSPSPSVSVSPSSSPAV